MSWVDAVSYTHLDVYKRQVERVTLRPEVVALLVFPLSAISADSVLQLVDDIALEMCIRDRACLVMLSVVAHDSHLL